MHCTFLYLNTTGIKLFLLLLSIPSICYPLILYTLGFNMTTSENINSNKKDLSISMVKANLLSIYFALPVLILALIYILIWGLESASAIYASFKTKTNVIWILIGILAGIIAHELIHGFAWRYFGNKKSGQIKFGINWKTLTPYAHCTEPMEVEAYRIGAAAPGIILGLIPYLIGLVAGNPVVSFFGLFFCFAASGDALILWTIRGVRSGKQVEDHPTRAGCYMLD